MKRDLVLIGSILLTIGFVYCAAKADEPQIVTINVMPTPTPVAERLPVSEDIPKYKLPKKDVERIARLLWSSPLRSESEKTKLIWLVLNRADHGYPFGDSIHDVVNSSEFTWFDRKARVSDKNRELVERVMNLWYASKDGYSIGSRPSSFALYCRFSGEGNRSIELLDEYKKVVY